MLKFWSCETRKVEGYMKKILYYILKAFLILFMLFGIIGIISLATMPDMDVGGVAFYIIWAAIGFSFLFLLSKYKGIFVDAGRAKQDSDFITTAKSETYLSKDSLDIDSPVPAAESSIPISNEKASDVNIEFSGSVGLSTEPPLGDKRAIFPDIYISFDVETPNKNNDRISQIGLLLIQDGKIIENHSTLVNPETYFDPINTKLTGIDSSTVCHAPTFNNYWNSIKELFEKYVVVSHNASFDLTVLYKTLDYYGLQLPLIKYICTYNESMNRFPDLEKFSLSAMADHFNIPLGNHHDAGADARTCSLIFEAMKTLHFTFIPEEFILAKSGVVPTNLQSKEKNLDSFTETISLPYVRPEESDINGMRCVLTGVFTMLPKSSLTEYIENHGGKVTASVSGLTNYLIVGSKPEPAWKYGNYGSKINKALTLISEGNKKIQFVREEDFLSTFVPNRPEQ